ncbi:MAG: phenylalanine--tRNA ligase subunit alpha [Candidatus Paceibacterota bacterium]
MKHSEKHGHYHPLTRIIRHSVNIFSEMGFEVDYGPEIETEENNFDNLNMPPDHPARDMQDTFWIKNDPSRLLRTQTSAHQVPYMQSHTPPFRMVSYGKVFRNEATDKTHNAQFHQLEGVAVDTKGEVTLAHLKGSLFKYIEEMFGNVEKRLRPGYFPFVEPGVEVDIYSKNKWLEVLGGGMVHPTVLENANLDPQKYSGFAFGIGIDRIAMIKYGIEDIRHLYSGDLRFINQF